MQVSRPELQAAWGSSDHFATLPRFLPSGRTAVFSAVPHLVQICCGWQRRCLWGPRHPAAATCLPAAWRLPRPLGVDAGGADPEASSRVPLQGTQPCVLSPDILMWVSVWERKRCTHSLSLGFVACVISQLHIWKRYFNFL